MMKKAFFAALALLASTTLFAQNDSPWKLEWHGFVNPHFYADSRQVVGGREEMMLFYPKAPSIDDSTGIDVNDGWNMNMLSITARLNLKVSGPDILGAKTFAFIEGDFTGSTNATNNNLRLRHAYFNMDWGKSVLLAGQYWYPMVVPEIMPNTRPLNMGAPFHPYARYNQVRYTQKLGANWDAFGAVLFQQDNMSQGLLNGVPASSTQFIRQGCVPELHLQVRYNDGHLFAGAAANVTTIQPEVWTSAPAIGLGSNYGETFSTFSYTLFAKYRWQHWALSMQTLLNNSLYEGCSMGGYFIQPEAMGVNSYHAWHFNTVWADFGKVTGKWRPGIFCGFAKNMAIGQDVNIGTQWMGRGANMEYLWRVQPRIGYHATDKFNIYAEAEYTFAQYAKIQNSSAGLDYCYAHDDNGGVGNLRLMLSAEYRF